MEIHIESTALAVLFLCKTGLEEIDILLNVEKQRILRRSLENELKFKNEKQVVLLFVLNNYF